MPARVTLLAAARYANSVKPFHSTPPRASFSLSACLAYLTARVAASRQPVLCDHRPILAGSVSSPTSQTAAFGMSGSRRERQLTGAAANSHSRPAADGPERLLPGPRRHGTCAGSEKPQPSSGASTVALGRSGNLRIRVSRPSRLMFSRRCATLPSRPSQSRRIAGPCLRQAVDLGPKESPLSLAPRAHD